MSKLYGISYTSRQFNNRYNIITKLGNECGLFDTFKCFTENDIDNEFKEKYKEVWTMPKGAGYWIWKPYIILKMLEQLNDNDILVYSDGGCHINITPDSKQRFNEYINMINHSKIGLLRFQLTHQEKNFTNKKTINYFKTKFNISDEMMNTYLESMQCVGGIQLMKKTKYTLQFFKQILEILSDDCKLFTDIYTETNEKHRHDQSIMSLLYKHMNGDLIIDDETYFGGDQGNFNTIVSNKYPFWATRLRS